jgi:hypothetical protein
VNFQCVSDTASYYANNLAIALLGGIFLAVKAVKMFRRGVRQPG